MASAVRLRQARTLVEGSASGVVLKLTEPLNVWGGLDPATGTIVHPNHPQRGQCVAGRALVLSHTRGSGTNAQVLAEAWRRGRGPAAVLVLQQDDVLSVGAIVAAEAFGVSTPVVQADQALFDDLRSAQTVHVDATPGRADITIEEWV